MATPTNRNREVEIPLGHFLELMKLSEQACELLSYLVEHVATKYSIKLVYRNEKKDKAVVLKSSELHKKRRDKSNLVTIIPHKKSISIGLFESHENWSCSKTSDIDKAIPNIDKFCRMKIQSAKSGTKPNRT